MTEENISEEAKRQRLNLPELFSVSASPHIHGSESTATIMLTVLIALLPAVIWGVYAFGVRALLMVLITVASCVLSEFLYELFMKKPITVKDLSAAVTGVLLALSLSPTMPLWMPAVGGVFAIVVVKQLFGGLGKNFLNPALTARAFMYCWPAAMTMFSKFDVQIPILSSKITSDVYASATPLVNINEGIPPESSIIQLFLGQVPGCIGEVSSLLILLGGAFLLIRRVITWHIPAAYLGTVALITFVFGRGDLAADYMWYSLFSGGLMLGAVFMATDYVTSPVSSVGKIIYGIGCGVITVFIRYFGGYAEGVTFAILIMNLLTWYIDKMTRPSVFGKIPGKRRKKKRKIKKEAV